MTGNEIAIDTNQAIAVLNNDARAVLWIRKFARVYLPVPVMAELRFGALNSAKADYNSQRVSDFIARTMILDISASTAEIHACLRLALKKMGKPVPQNDLWIAAICVQYDVALATADAHFDDVPGLTVEKV